MDVLDQKLNDVYPGRVVRKDLLHQIKEGTNVPSFVLEFLLAKYCASEDPDEIEAGKAAVLEVIERNYVRPDEANKAQSVVQQRGSHKFIDKVHVQYVEKERRHWAEMENFGSRRIAIPAKFYRDNDRLLEGGIWAEVKIAHNDIDEDDYAFYIEDLRPIQLGKFDYDKFIDGRSEFTRDEWLDVIIRSIGLEPSKMEMRLKFHFISRLISLVEANYNFIELGPRGTGKSYSFSEFSPYSTLISGGQASTATLFYNNVRRKVGLIGFWDTVAFDEVAGIKIKDQGSVQIMKDYMANGRFSRGVEVNAPASLSFVGNIDHSIQQLVNSHDYDLFQPLPGTFDLAIMDRFHTYLPGWEMPKNTRALLTNKYGFISDYLAEAFHYLFRYSNRYDFVKTNCKLGKTVEGRDEKAILKTVSAFIKMLHPNNDPEKDELEQYLAYALEGRRRVKEQMNKRKPDDEFANINLSYFNNDGEEVIVYCPESKGIEATQIPRRKVLESIEVVDENKEMNESEAQSEESDIKGIQINEEVDIVSTLIKNGEDKTTEFKSSMRWDFKSKQTNKDLEYEIAKTIAAFGNTNGGNLLIGVTDKGEIVGIENDYKTLGRRNTADGFKLQLGNVIKTYLGIEISPFVDAKIFKYSDHDICLVKVEKSPKPIYVNEDQFIIRTVAASEKLNLKKTMEYIQENW